MSMFTGAARKLLTIVSRGESPATALPCAVGLIASIVVTGSLGLTGCEDDPLGQLRPVISIDQTELDFGQVQVGATRRISVAVTNTGTADLQVASIRTTFTMSASGTPNPFGVSVSEVLVGPGGTQVVDVTFSPTADDIATGTVLISSDDRETPEVIINVRGQGVSGQLVVQPTTLDLTGTTVGRSRAVELVARNLSLEALAGAELVAEGFERPEHFRLTGLPRFDQRAPFALDARVRQVLTLTYEPQELGDDNGYIRIETCGPRCGYEIEVRASANEAILRLTPPAIEFGDVGIGQPRTDVLQIENVGTMVAAIQSIEAAGSAAFSVSPALGTLPRELQPGERFDVNVTFTPTEATEVRGSVVVRTNLGSVPQLQAALVGRGEGPLFLVQPSLVNFETERGPGRYERAVVLVNAGSSVVEVSEVRMTGDSVFGLGPLFGLPVTIGPGESQIVPVVFEPTEVGQYQGALFVTSDDPASPTTSVPVVAAMSERLCELRLTPDRLLFGLMPPGHDRTRRVVVENVGRDICRIESGAFREPIDPEIRLAGGPGLPVTLEPTSTTTSGDDSSIAFEFVYAPTEPRAAKATFVLQTGDQFFPERAISMAGRADTFPLLFVRPEAVDFGAMVPEECPEFLSSVSLFNVGRAGVRHLQTRLTSPTTEPLTGEFRLEAATVPGQFDPLVPGAAFLYELGYLAVDEGPDRAELEITMEGYPQPFVVPLKGEGSEIAEREEVFQQVDNKEVDVLFVIDDSCSMEENQRQVAQNFDRFIREADARQVDFHLGITTTDTIGARGQLVGPVITRATPDFQEVFKDQANVGTGGSATEKGLEAMQGALDEADRGSGYAAALIRPSAALVVIIVSDEDDQSNELPTFYANDLVRRAPNGVLPAVVSGQAAGCTSPSGIADVAPRYEEFIDFFGNGVSASICADWGVTLGNLGGEAFGLRRAFRLSIAPAVSPPLVVTVDGVPVQPPAYEVVGQDVVFATPPPEGSEIRIRYRPDC